MQKCHGLGVGMKVFVTWFVNFYLVESYFDKTNVVLYKNVTFASAITKITTR